MNTRILLTVLTLGWLVLGSPLHAQTLDDTDPVSAFFVNGVLTEYNDASASAIELAQSWAERPTRVPGVRFGLAYNPKDGFFADLIEAGKQAGIDTREVLRQLQGLSTLSPVLEAEIYAINRQWATQAPVTAGVVAEHVRFYRTRLDQKHKIILVAHSQGNFFANSEFDTLNAPGEKQCTYTINVATPSNRIPTKGSHTTLQSDLIIAAASEARVIGGQPAAAAPNVAPNAGNGATARNSLGHSFRDAYLFPGSDSKDKILDELDTARALARTEGTPCKPMEAPPANTTRTLEAYSTFGGPITPIAIGYSTTTTQVSDGSTTTQSFSDPNFQGLANYIDETRSSATFTMCKVEDTWIAKHSTRSGTLPAPPLRAQCSGTGYVEVDTSDFSFAGGTLTATFTIDGSSSVSCDDTVGLVVNRTSTSQTNNSTSTMVINLVTGVGTYDRDLNQGFQSTGTYTGADGMLKTTNTTSTTTGGAHGSWSPANPQAPLNNTRITKSTSTLQPGAPIPQSCY